MPCFSASVRIQSSSWKVDISRLGFEFFPPDLLLDPIEAQLFGGQNGTGDQVVAIPVLSSQHVGLDPVTPKRFGRRRRTGRGTGLALGRAKWK